MGCGSSKEAEPLKPPEQKTKPPKSVPQQNEQGVSKPVEESNGPNNEPVQTSRSNNSSRQQRFRRYSQEFDDDGVTKKDLNHAWPVRYDEIKSGHSSPVPRKQSVYESYARPAPTYRSVFGKLTPKEYTSSSKKKSTPPTPPGKRTPSPISYERSYIVVPASPELVVRNEFVDGTGLRGCIARVAAKPNLNHYDHFEDITTIYAEFKRNDEDSYLSVDSFKEMVQYGFVEMQKRVWKEVFEESLFLPGKEKTYKLCCEYLLTCLWKLCDSQEAGELTCREIAKVNFDRDIINYFLSEPLKPHKLVNNKIRAEVAKAFIDILHHLVRLMPERRKALRDFHTVDTLQTIRETRNPTLAAAAFLVQAHLINEDENERFNSTEETFADAEYMLDMAVKKTPYHLDTIFKESEIVEALNRLATMDSNVNRMISSGVVDHYVDLLRSKDFNVRFLAVKGLWLMAYKGRQQLLNTPGLSKAFKEMKSDDEVNKLGARGAMFVMQHKDTEAAARYQKTKTTKSSHEYNFTNERGGLPGPVYISSAPDCEDLVEKLTDVLNDNQINTTSTKDWLDNPLDDIPNAIESSAVVLICMTEGYKESAIARFEAQYTRNLEKKYIPLMMMKNGYVPDGWLAEFLGDEQNHYFTNNGQSRESANNVIKRIQNMYPKAVAKEETIIEFAMSREGTFTYGEEFNSRPPSRRDTSLLGAGRIPNSWTKEQVAKWLDENDVSSMKQAFALTDGPLLAEWMRMRYDAPEAFFQKMFKSFNTQEVLTFTKALRKLRKMADKYN